MIDRFRQYCEEHQLFNLKKPVGLAISGGKDSVTCAHLLNELEIPFVMLHCNFNLRGAESNGDQKFVEQLGQELIACKGVYTEQFDTESYHKEKGLSVQEAARHLRYKFFDRLHSEGLYEKLITCHHRTDQLETFFINLIRISGISGLKGIPNQRDYIVRPMLKFSSVEILEYAKNKGYHYREDSSNASNKYLRNKLRNNVLPVLEEHVPNFEESASKSIDILRKQEELYKFTLQQQIDLIVDYQHLESTHSINIDKLLSYPQPAVLLYHFLDSYGFNFSQCEQIIASCNKQSGKLFFSQSHQLLIEREQLILKEQTENTNTHVAVPVAGDYNFGPKQFSIKLVARRKNTDSSMHEFISLNDHDFPLTIRHWQEGDYIYPLGMKGKKLLSDFFIDNKFSRFDKEQTVLLAKEQEVVWIVGHRISENYKVNSDSTVYEVKMTL